MYTSTSLKNQPSAILNNTHQLSYDHIESMTLKGIEVSLFSFQISLAQYELRINEICGTHFQYSISSVSNEGVMTVYISPKEYCLVNGGMMYKSAGSILTDLVSNGFMVKSFRTVE